MQEITKCREALRTREDLRVWLSKQKEPSQRLIDATHNLHNCMWYAAVNGEPPRTMTEDVAAFEDAKSEAQRT